jgi:purine-binding chemotaxis protein CheW
MNSSLIISSSSTPKQTKAAAAIVRVILFRIGTLNLAIRLESVNKILKNTPIDSSGTNSFGVAQVGDREITILDLQRQLFGDSGVAERGIHSHLILLKTASGEPFGIPVAEVPTLIEIALTSLRVLPESYRRADTLSMATHVARVPQGDGELTVFLVDTNLLNPF